MTVFKAVGLTVPETKTEHMLLRTPDQTHLAPRLVVGAADQTYKRTVQFLYLGCILTENAELSLAIDRQIRLMWSYLKRLGPVSLKYRMLKVGVNETLFVRLCYVGLQSRTLHEQPKG